MGYSNDWKIFLNAEGHWEVQESTSKFYGDASSLPYYFTVKLKQRKK